MIKYDLKNRVAIVTGGAQGFGLAITKRFIESGAKVLIWDKDTEYLNKVDLKNTQQIEVDVSNYKSVENAFAESLTHENKIDILINNAGIAGPNFKTWDYPLEEWQKVIDIDLTGVFYCCKTIVPHFIKNNYGRIVNISSIAGKEGNPNAMPYSAAKAGVIALTKSLGKELAKYNIAVNAITPAGAKTKILDQN